VTRRHGTTFGEYCVFDIRQNSLYSQHTYRFDVDQLYRLADALRLPPVHITETRNVVPVLEGVGLVCARYSRPGNLHDLAERFDRCQSAISEIVNEYTALIDNRWSHILDFDTVLLSPENLEKYATAVSNCGSPMATIWGFLDCTIRQICRPSLAQRLAYNGYKKMHALKFQAVMLPNGLIGHLFGPVEGRRADPHLLTESGLLDRCIRWATRPGTTAATPPALRHFQLFGDAAYGVSNIMMSPFTTRFGRQPTPEQLAWNTAMSSVRIEVEHGFARVLALWPFLRCWWKMEALSSPVGRYYRVGVLLTNAFSCLEGQNQVSEHFNCPPPDLEEYLHV
jgi:hypothetical protein